MGLKGQQLEGCSGVRKQIKSDQDGIESEHDVGDGAGDCF